MDALPILVKGVGKFVPPPSGPYIYALGVLGTGAKGFHTVAREAMNYASGNQVNLNRALGGAGMAVGAGLNGGGYFPGFDQHTAKLMQGVGETLESVGTGLKGGADISDLHARRGGHPEPSPLPATDDSFNSRTAAGVAAHMRSSHLPAPTATPYSGGTTRLPQLPAPSAGRTR
ncbi:hypothetical protein QFZ63_000068 [Streptomyces sp. B3I7]|nr:hypothetical protein [Streptomyces sp. B3I7]